MMNPEAARAFAHDWIESWNAHDLDRILSHYTDDFVMTSPVIISAMNEPGGKLTGKDAIRSYWARALTKYPDLFFELRHVLTGVDSVTIVYDGVRGRSAEVFHFNDQGKVHAAYAHYDL